jgi:hypothetical protein
MTSMTNDKVSILPPALTEVMGYMQIQHFVCPPEVKTRILGLRVNMEEESCGRIPTNWRTPNSGRRCATKHEFSTFRPAVGVQPRFGHRGDTSISVEVRMMDRILDKMNKFSPLTYDSIKCWLSQLLDSGETSFLTDFITLVFEKAASEAAFCKLYAKLITELRESFPHLNVELLRIFDDYMSIFTEVRDAPDITSADYKKFLKLRDQRKFRRGYSMFLGEIVHLGVLPVKNLVATCSLILDELQVCKKQEGQQLLCEEYADCLLTLMKSCTLPSETIELFRARIKDAMDKKDSVSLTNKARFGLMDIQDMLA